MSCDSTRTESKEKNFISFAQRFLHTAKKNTLKCIKLSSTCETWNGSSLALDLLTPTHTHGRSIFALKATSYTKIEKENFCLHLMRAAKTYTKRACYLYLFMFSQCELLFVCFFLSFVLALLLVMSWACLCRFHFVLCSSGSSPTHTFSPGWIFLVLVYFCRRRLHSLFSLSLLLCFVYVSNTVPARFRDAFLFACCFVCCCAHFNWISLLH